MTKFSIFRGKAERTIRKFFTPAYALLAYAFLGIFTSLTACSIPAASKHDTPRSIAKVNFNSKTNICLTMMSFTETSEAFKKDKGNKVYYSMAKRYVHDIDMRSAHYDDEARAIIHSIYQNPYDRELHRRIHNYCGESIFLSNQDMLQGYYKEVFRLHQFTPNWDM